MIWVKDEQSRKAPSPMWASPGGRVILVSAPEEGAMPSDVGESGRGVISVSPEQRQRRRRVAGMGVLLLLLLLHGSRRGEGSVVCRSP